MDDENIYERIQDLLGHFPENFNILEEQIDIDLQMEYFEFSRKVKKKPIPGDVEAIRSSLLDKTNSTGDKKRMLAQLASLEEVEAFRAIEKYLEMPDNDLKDWAVLASQESRMLLQSKLLDENQVFISTGLGGKGLKLRYFIVLVNNFDKAFDKLQQKIIRTEFDFFLGKYDAEMENIDFMESYCSLLAVVPIKVPVREVFRTAINECNEYGGFIRTDFIITNVKKLSYEEISGFLNKKD